MLSRRCHSRRRAGRDCRFKSCRCRWRICERRTNAVGLGEAQSVRLPYTLPALVDLRAILDYIAAHSRQSARRVQARIQSSRRSSVAESLHRAPPERSDPSSVAPSGANLIFDILTKGRATDAFARRGIATNEEGWALLMNDDLQSSSSGHP